MFFPLNHMSRVMDRQRQTDRETNYRGPSNRRTDRIRRAGQKGLSSKHLNLQPKFGETYDIQGFRSATSKQDLCHLMVNINVTKVPALSNKDMKQFEELCSNYKYKIDTNCLKQGIESTGNLKLADQYKKLGKIVKKRKMERNKEKLKQHEHDKQQKHDKKLKQHKHDKHDKLKQHKHNKQQKHDKKLKQHKHNKHDKFKQ